MQKKIIYMICIIFGIFFLFMIFNIHSTYINKKRPSVYIHIFIEKDTDKDEQYIQDYYQNKLPNSHIEFHVYSKNDNLDDLKKRCLKKHKYKSWVIFNLIFDDNNKLLRITEEDLIEQASNGVTHLNTGTNRIECFVNNEHKVESDKVYELDEF